MPSNDMIASMVGNTGVVAGEGHEHEHHEHVDDRSIAQLMLSTLSPKRHNIGSF